MENFKDLKVLKESKDSIINKMNLTDEQKRIAKDFFNKYNAYEKEVDWNQWKTLTWEDLSAVIYKDRSRDTKQQVKKSIRKGLEGFKEDEDYEILAEGEFHGEPYVAYLPRNWEASRMIASKNVEPCDTEARWCTAYQKTDSYWKDHNRHERFIYYCGKGIYTEKVAVSIEIGNSKSDANQTEYEWNCEVGDEDVRYNLWDSDDNHTNVDRDDLPNDLEKLIGKIYLRFCTEAERDEREDAIQRLGEEGEYIVDAWDNIFWEGDYNLIEEYYIGAYDSDEAFVADMMSEDKWEDILQYIDLLGFANELADDMWADEADEFKSVFGVDQNHFDDLKAEELEVVASDYLEGCGMGLDEMFTGFLKKFVNTLSYMGDHNLDCYNGYYFYRM